MSDGMQPVVVTPPGAMAAPSPAPLSPPQGAPAAGVVSPSPAAAPQADTVPVSKADMERYQRYEQQISQLRPLYDKLSPLGIKSAADVDRLSPILKAMTSAQQAETPAQPQSQTTGALTADQIAMAVDQRISYRSAQEQHNAAIRGETTLVTSAVEKIVGSNASQAEKDLTRRIVSAMFEERRQPYQVGHPLERESLAPINEQLAEAVVKEISDLRTAARAASLASQQPKPGFTATPGVSAGLGQPPQSSPTGQPMSKTQLMAQARIAAQQYVAAMQPPSGM